MAKLTAEQAREKFGLSYNDSHASGGGSLKDGALYVNGNYIGSMSGTKMEEQRSGPDKEAEGIDKYKAIQDYSIDSGFGEERAEWNTYNDVQGAIEEVIGDDAPEKPEAPAPVDEGPIEYSPEIMQAKERVQNYENNILSGKTSRDIYGNDSAFKDEYKLNLKNMNQGFLDKYQFNPDAPAAGAQDGGIKPTKYQPDTFSGSDISPYDTKDSKDRATESFLDEQKRKVIKQANITPYQ